MKVTNPIVFHRRINRTTHKPTLIVIFLQRDIQKMKAMEALHLRCILPLSITKNSLFTLQTTTPLSLSPFSKPPPLTLTLSSSSSQTATVRTRAGFFFGRTKDDDKKKKKKMNLPDTVKAGDPVLHEPAQEVDPSEIMSDKVQKIIDDMIRVMRKAPGVGLAAPQIGVSSRIIVLEDTKEFISYAPKEVLIAQDRHPFDLLVIVNPRLKSTSKRTALFFEGCLSVDGFRAVVERHLDVEVTGLDRNGEPIKITASGWQARILQHECDHLDGTLYVDKMVPRTFRTVENMDLPLAQGCPKLGPR